MATIAARIVSVKKPLDPEDSNQKRLYEQGALLRNQKPTRRRLLKIELDIRAHEPVFFQLLFDSLMPVRDLLLHSLP